MLARAVHELPSILGIYDLSLRDAAKRADSEKLRRITRENRKDLERFHRHLEEHSERLEDTGERLNRPGQRERQVLEAEKAARDAAFTKLDERLDDDVDLRHSDRREYAFSMFRGYGYADVPSRDCSFVFVDGPSTRTSDAERIVGAGADGLDSPLWKNAFLARNRRRELAVVSLGYGPIVSRIAGG